MKVRGSPTFVSSLAVVLAGSIVVGCGPSPVPLVLPTSAPATHTAAPIASEPEAVPQRRSSEAFVAAARPDAVVAWVKRMLFAPEVAQLERGLGLAPGSLSTPEGLEALGVDRAGTATLEAFELDARSAAEAERLAHVDRAQPDAELADALVLESKRVQEGFVLTRLRVPAKPGGALRRVVETALQRAHASQWRAPSADVSVLGFEEAIWILRDVPGALEVSIAMGQREIRGALVRSAVAALSAWGEGTLPRLDGDDFALVVHPAAIARAGAWIGVSRTAEVAFGEAIDPSQSRRILVEGFREATQALRLDAPRGAPRYAEVRVAARGPRVVVRSSLAKDEPSFEPSSWSASVDTLVPGASSFVSINGALAYDWPLLPATDGLNPYLGGAAHTAMRESGFAGYLLLLGDAPFFAARLSLELAEPLSQPTRPFLQRFERLGVAMLPRSVVHVGTLVASATEEKAACALSRVDEKCPKAERIPTKGALAQGGFYVSRRRIDDRWVLVASRDKAALDATKIELAHGAHRAVEGALDFDSMFGRKGLGRYRVEVALGADGRSFEATCNPIP